MCDQPSCNDCGCACVREVKERLEVIELNMVDRPTAKPQAKARAQAVRGEPATGYGQPSQPQPTQAKARAQAVRGEQTAGYGQPSQQPLQQPPTQPHLPPCAAQQQREQLQHQQSVGITAENIGTVSIQTQAHTQEQARRAPAVEGLAWPTEAGSTATQSPPTVRQLDYLMVLLRRQGVPSAQARHIVDNVPTKAAATWLISQALAGQPVT